MGRDSRTYARLVPELDVSDLDASLRFYTEVCGFGLLYRREAERFVYIDLDGASLMLQAVDGPGRRFRTAALENPYGRGINLQIQVNDVDRVSERVLASDAEVVLPPEDRWYELPTGKVCSRQLVVADPDGYLLRFFEDVGDARSGTQEHSSADAASTMLRMESLSCARVAGPDDVETLLNLRRRLMIHMGAEDQEEAPEAEWIVNARDRLTRGMSAGQVVGAVVEIDGSVVAGGIAEIVHRLPSPATPDGRVGHISSMYTNPAHRGRGLGRSVVRLLLGQLADIGVTTAELYAASPQAEGLYRSERFVDRPGGRPMRYTAPNQLSPE